MTSIRLASIAFPIALLPLSGCQQGAEDERPGSVVRVTADHHLFGMVGKPNIDSFPVTPGDTIATGWYIEFRDDSSYNLWASLADRANGAGNQGGGTYTLESDGRLSLLVPTSGPTIVFRGAYGLFGDTGRMFFTDRVGDAVGLYISTRVVAGTADRANLAGAWHVLSMHALFADPTALPEIDAVGRAYAGQLTLAADGSFTGTGTESTNTQAQLGISGPADALQAFDGGRFALSIDYGQDNRSFDAGGDGAVIFGSDDDESDGAAGLLVLMRHRTDPLDTTRLAGKYTLGGWTMFLKPSTSGFDGVIGELELTETGSFRISAVGNAGADFEYTGTYAADDVGALTLTVSGTNETFHGAFDQDYRTVAIVDNFVESRPTRQVELNLFVGLRLVP